MPPLTTLLASFISSYPLQPALGFKLRGCLHLWDDSSFSLHIQGLIHGPLKSVGVFHLTLKGLGLNPEFEAPLLRLPAVSVARCNGMLSPESRSEMPNSFCTGYQKCDLRLTLIYFNSFDHWDTCTFPLFPVTLIYYGISLFTTIQRSHCLYCTFFFKSFLFLFSPRCVQSFKLLVLRALII